MSDEEILLLDHKKRSVRRRNVMRDDYYVEDSECIRADNYLLTGKKGGGCSKITALAEKARFVKGKSPERTALWMI